MAIIDGDKSFSSTDSALVDNTTVGAASSLLTTKETGCGLSPDIAPITESTATIIVSSCSWVLSSNKFIVDVPVVLPLGTVMLVADKLKSLVVVAVPLVPKAKTTSWYVGWDNVAVKVGDMPSSVTESTLADIVTLGATSLSLIFIETD